MLKKYVNIYYIDYLFLNIY